MKSKEWVWQGKEEGKEKTVRKVEEMLLYLQDRLDSLGVPDAQLVERLTEYFYENGSLSWGQVSLLKQVFFCFMRKE